MPHESTIHSLSEESRRRCLDGARRRIGGRLSPRVDPEDILHDSVVQMLTRPEGDGREGRAWSEGRILALAELRIRGAARHPIREQPGGVPIVFDGTSLGAEALSQRESADQVRHALTRLPQEYHWVLLLRDWLSVSWEVVALVLEQPTGNAAERLYQRARKSLGAELSRVIRQ